MGKPSNQSSTGWRIRGDYSRVWKKVCLDWLQWSQKRFERFLRAYNAKVVQDGSTNWFYDDPALWYIIPLMMTDDFEERLHKMVRRYRYGAPEWIYFRSEIVGAIEGVPKRKGRFDWRAAKDRAEEHLTLYKEKFPSPKTVTNYEKWVLRYYNPKLHKLLAAVAQRRGAGKAAS
jgi:hypothetical protein